MLPILSRQDPAKAISSTDLFAYLSLQPFQKTYLPWSASSLKPEAVQRLINEVFVNRRSRIVELGSGISTYFLAQALEARGGKVLSIDHDENWQKEVLTWGGLKESKSVIMQHAPLMSFNQDGFSGDWYNKDVVERALSEFGEIDMLIIDGPPAYRPELKFSRYPAIPAAKKLLSARSCIILDDINRKGEQMVAEKWTELLGANFQHRINNRAGISVWWSGQAFGSEM